MQTSELRHELHRLADEMEPFPGDLLALRRRERRRSALLRVAAAFVVVLTVAGAVALWNRGEKHVGVAKKEYAPADVRLDLVVVPGTERVRQVLEDSPVVARYAPLARGGLPVFSKETAGVRLHDAACALRGGDGFAVEVRVRDARDALAHLLGNDAKIFVVSVRGEPVDAEVFMKLGATQAQIDGVRAAIVSDATEVQSYRYLDHKAAFDEFKRLFADQPALVESTKPDVIPQSFRLVASDGTPSQALVRRFEHLAGVNTVIDTRGWAWVQLLPGSTSNAASCTTP